MWLRAMLVDNLKAAIPFLDQVRAAKRRLVPYSDNLANSRLALEQGLRQIAMLRAAGAKLGGDVLEIGTGWMPIIPMLFHVAGARHTTLTDIETLMDDATVAGARALVARHATEVAAALDMPEAEIARRLDAPWPHRYLSPWDIARHPRDSADIVVSRAVFEHIPPEVLARYLAELRGIVRPGAMMCHVVDNSDHWEHRDKSINRVNFLKYEDGPFWRFTCYNPQNYQNRLRHSDYVAMFRDAGWTILAAEGAADPASLAALPGLRLASRFRHHAPDDLAVLTSWLLVRRDS
ncbi:MAG: class I SAM-dependent methyltransferase [Acetobacteraceae bacterium]|nr:class I SAM-dependent methyltransferase [Acetobacteraceae bacterium]